MDTNLDPSPMMALSVLQILWINLLLSGDNAVVIALACRGLPPVQQRRGVVLGTTAAVVLRIFFAGIAAELMGFSYLRLAGAVVLLIIAVKLLSQDGEEKSDVAGASSFWRAVRTIVIADVAMSLDNVLAVVAAAKGNIWLIGFGLLLSVPLVIGGSALVTRLLARWPVLVWAGGALLGYIAGELAVEDPVIERLGYAWDDQAAPIVCMVLVIATGLLLTRLRRTRSDALGRAGR